MKTLVFGEVRGSNPAASIPFYINTNIWTNHIVTRVSTAFVDKQPTNMHHVIKLPHHHDGTALHVAVWTVRTGIVSIPNFSLFDLAIKSRYLVHTDSICENKYTARIRKTRRTQWHCFRLDPGTLKIEQILIPWSHFPSKLCKFLWCIFKHL